MVLPGWIAYLTQSFGIGHPLALGVLVWSPPKGVMLGVSVG
jgi:hypothetical protein